MEDTAPRARCYPLLYGPRGAHGAEISIPLSWPGFELQTSHLAVQHATARPPCTPNINSVSCKFWFFRWYVIYKIFSKFLMYSISIPLMGCTLLRGNIGYLWTFILVLLRKVFTFIHFLASSSFTF